MSEPVGRGPGGGPKLTWDELLVTGHKSVRIVRAIFKHLPSDPRCKLCIAPFGGLGGRATSFMGFGPSSMNPNFCANCLERLPPGGAEVDIAVLFADVRGSTGLGESLDSTTFARHMNRFYKTATQTLIKHDALIDKLLGDEVMALFVPGFCGPTYRQRACDAAVELLEVVRTDPGLAGWLSIGVGLHAGPAFVGNVGGEGVFDFTALGDTVNVGARLQSFAAAGELVLSEEIYRGANSLGPAEPRSVTVKGRAEPIDIRIVRPS